MAVKPILFSGSMVRAILDGRKTVTRRVLKPQPPSFTPQVIDIQPPTFDAAYGGWGQWQTEWHYPPSMPMGEPLREIWRPLRGLRFAPGDLLWCRETWKPHSTFEGTPPRDIPPSRVFYAADKRYAPSNTRWRPGIHMPRWASRLTLAVTSVWVHRLQDISEDDVIAEGIHPLPQQSADDPSAWWESAPGQHQARSASQSFRLLWNSINGPSAWEANPWVAAISFETHRANVDAVLSQREPA